MDSNNIRDIRNQLEQRKGHAAEIRKQLKKNKKEQINLKNQISQHEKALEIVKQVALKTQKELEYHISNLISSAIDGVFPNNEYEFKVKFIERRGKTECDLVLTNGDEEINPIEATGGGLVDIISLALRVSFLSMQNKKYEPVLLLDEPFKHLSTDLQNQAAIMLKELADKIGLQVIYISHSEDVSEIADKVFTVKKVKGISHVK